MGQYLIVALIVALAALYVGMKYLPAGWRRRLVHALTRRGASQPALARWLDTESSCGSGCGSCGACETEPSAPPDGHRVIKLHLKR